MNPFIQTITSEDPTLRDRPFEDLCEGLDAPALNAACAELETFRRGSENLYHRVRASLYLHAIYRFHLMEHPDVPVTGALPYAGFEDLLARRYEEALDRFLRARRDEGLTGALASALSECYHHLTFQTLMDQVRKSVRASQGNRWMFRVGHPADHPLRVRRELLHRAPGDFLYPVLAESTPVRLDLSHRGWSDIFFLGMDYPEGARVINISVDLAVYGRDDNVRSPIECYVRVIEEPLLRVTCVDLEATKDITDLADLFNFGNDYLSLVKAGIIASGLIPPSFEGTGYSLASILGGIVGKGLGLEVVTKVNDIPKGSRLAVSTNLLAGLVALLMRATGQTESITGPLREDERRLAASRAILGEWLGGSGGGWQDSGGIWPGIKIIEGAPARESDPEWGVSRGRLLPEHRLLKEDDVGEGLYEKLAQSIVLVHGGMAQNVGPILELVTEKYLLRSKKEWEGRAEAGHVLAGLINAIRDGDVRALGRQTNANWEGPLKTIIPWVTTRFTETLIARSREALGDDFWGFLMLGGMSGGGMALFVAPEKRDAYRDTVLQIMAEAKAELEDALPFAMQPVVYDFRINRDGTTAQLHTGESALLPARYYGVVLPKLVQREAGALPQYRRAEIDYFANHGIGRDEAAPLFGSVVSNLFRASGAGFGAEQRRWDEEAAFIKSEFGFDAVQHEKTRRDLLDGRIGLARNRLPADTEIEDVRAEDLIPWNASANATVRGEKALANGEVAVLSLAGGVGSRWTTGAGVIKALNPFVTMGGRHRSFLELHLAKTRRAAETCGVDIPHVVSTSFLTHAPIARHLNREQHYGYTGPVYLSPGRSIGQRLIPMKRDLVFLWEEMQQEVLDEQKQKVREAVRASLIGWAQACGEGSDYADNAAAQRFNPPGHWYEVANLLLNGVLRELLEARPQLTTLMLHNIDTLGADVDPIAVGAHLESGATLTFEVVPRRIEDRGGGLARVNGHLRLLEGLAQPREEDELRLRYYNSMTTWIAIDPLLETFGLTREGLGHTARVAEAVRRMADRVPTYVTIKEVKRRWGHGQEDVYPVAQTEKLWSDMTALRDVPCAYLAVPRLRGQQLKDLNQLDAWANDGSKAHVEGLCALS